MQSIQVRFEAVQVGLWLNPKALMLLCGSFHIDDTWGERSMEAAQTHMALCVGNASGTAGLIVYSPACFCPHVRFMAQCG